MGIKEGVGASPPARGSTSAETNAPPLEGSDRLTHQQFEYRYREWQAGRGLIESGESYCNQPAET